MTCVITFMISQNFYKKKVRTSTNKVHIHNNIPYFWLTKKQWNDNKS